MEGWKDGTKNRMQKERETKKRAKNINKSEPPRRVPNYERIFLQQTKQQKRHATKRHGIGIVRLQRWQTILRYVFAARRAQKTNF